ncbi:ABC transporter ATP-binding protein [Staphylococcus pseudintermedius]|uniref:ABC transporter ATP-binding protein n=1 Tax=Staphylococcus pseudintermedius TaxID=283734 RepID=UPI002AC932A3|nr:ABC transporter ATP-binding protein [Staphylococcus pseudintermedius]EIS6478746.1 ABC transporter ATP-binding protein [Staphylococcus pseudintermedius]EJD5775720.1 ABC transporter ATP-binding protein [Staphylococcus pseudintermedius]EJE4551507.1 ABC transporter ATP-binding protein [Staphylococcus pseudintermedius]WQL64906.1 ABC transporter ATP-binding protein [Staphylococcus pseudintermedius]HAR6111143.1 ABC transporter ATP-binding protein [Staphylococcus pseudintermedius]
MTYKVKVDNVSKIYDLNKSKISKILSLLSFGYFYRPKPYYALYNVSFEVEPGASVGLIGLNGSGKSTLSNILAEVLKPSKGTVDINGQSSLIAISAGLKNDFSGEENIRYKCLMHGMTTKEINAVFDDIVAFSELGEFIYQPIKSYSSGMKARLGFSIAIHTNPDVLIVDEALSVGDETFANKCIAKMKTLQQEGKTIFFVSHSAAQIKNMCDKAIWIHYGEMIEYGDVNHVVKRYNTLIRGFKARNKAGQLAYKKKMLTLQQQRSDTIEQSEMNPVEGRTLISLAGSFLLFIVALLSQIGVF